ncbi:transketolase [Rhodococcus sp. NPDC057297]|uniref:transketolase n=1 Tax=Rhodococcus sp. NPDC057297 TaxID=3346090 RepID=UPI00363941B8
MITQTPAQSTQMSRLAPDQVAAQKYLNAMSSHRGMGTDQLAPLLADVATAIRRDIITTIQGAGLGHIGGDLSVTDILVAAYWGVMSVNPLEPTSPDRDRFVLSKGHCATALYSTLASAGFFPREELRTFAKPLSALNGHPNRVKVPGVETNTGPLGHGFPVAVGAALGARLSGREYRTIVVMGDGEMQEGSNWEAAMTASHYELSSLTAIVDRNRLQQGARTEDTSTLEPLHDKWSSFGFETRRIDGHDYSALLEALGPSTSGKPVAIVADTIKGKGISFIEDRVEWHHKVPTDDQVKAALEELSA